MMKGFCCIYLCMLAYCLYRCCRWEYSLGQLYNKGTGYCLTFVAINKPITVIPCGYITNQQWRFSKQYPRVKPVLKD